MRHDSVLPKWLTYRVSIHASVKDATSALSLSQNKISSFNPRICKRCDPQATYFYDLMDKFQSTHL